MASLRRRKRAELKSWLWPAVLGLGLWALGYGDAVADKRVALVIGNGAYAHAPHLSNPPHDAEDVTAALQRSGFEVIQGIDLDQTRMQDAAISFARAARTANVAIFYYSGHAIQYAGVNYLVPVDAKLTDDADLRRMARVDEILADLQQAKNLRILVLDSCRDNPLAEQLKRSIGLTRAASIQRGLAKIDAPEGMIVAYATQAGRTADDGRGRNSPYTTAFLRHIEEKEEIGTVFRQISADVYEATKREQLPELSISFIGQFYLNGKLEVTVTPVTPSQPADPCAGAADHWRSVEAIGTLVAYEDHLARFANCTYATLAKERIDGLRNKERIDGLRKKNVVGNLLDGINLPGADYSNFWMESAQPELCQNACRSDASCAAWTYVRPGIQGARPRCWLKTRVPQQYRSTCCVSGIERDRER
ncbi:MAG TPA: caspase family protein [Xanthobacteraceae bacterium]|nr:caspase family protein [Xanthobacteraceae bacterium]